MRLIEENNLVIHIYDAIEEIPALFHNAFNIAILESQEIGYGIGSLKEHNQKILEFLQFNKTDYALEQAKNQSFCLANMESNYNPKRAAFCNLICTINNKEPLSREVDYLLALIKDISEETIDKAVEEVKKKLLTN
jgi:hypothetical protein